VVSNFLSPPNEDKEESTVFLLDEVVRQQDEGFLGFLSRLRYGELTDEDVSFLESRCMENLPHDEREKFQEAIHLVPNWSMATDITFNYLRDDFVTPLAVLQAVKKSVLQVGNCFSNSNIMPTISALCVGAKVMMQHNFLVEHKLMNGSIGTVMDICYPTPSGPYDPDYEGKAEYVVVDFPQSTLPVSLVPGKPSTCVPVPVTVCRCDNNCCTCSTIPLRVCKATSVHKAQGGTFGAGQVFTHCVSYSPQRQDVAQTPGLELVALSRPQRPTDMAIGNKVSDMEKSAILKIGTTESYKERRRFHSLIADRAAQSRLRIQQRITEVDPNPIGGTYEGGCEYLLKWFRDRVGPHGAMGNNE
jgi:hypothetical protein